MCSMQVHGQLLFKVVFAIDKSCSGSAICIALTRKLTHELRSVHLSDEMGSTDNFPSHLLFLFCARCPFDVVQLVGKPYGPLRDIDNP